MSVDKEALVQKLKGSIQVGGDGEPPAALDVPELWRDLLAVSATDPKTTQYIGTLVFLLSQRETDPIRGANLPVIDAVVQKFVDQELPLDARLDAAKTIIPWLPALSIEYVTQILQGSVAYIRDYLRGNDNSAFPKAFLNLYDKDVLDGLDEHAAKHISAFFRAAPASPDFGPALGLLATFIHWLAESLINEDGDEQFPSLFNPLLLAALDGADPIVRAGAAFALRQLGEHDPEGWPNADALYEKLQPLIISDSAIAAKYGSGALAQAVAARVLIDPKFLGLYVGTFEAHTTSVQQRMFSKVMSAYIFADAPDDSDDDDEEEEKPPDLRIMQPIVDWVASVLGHKDLFARAIGLDVLGDVAVRSKMCAEDLIGRALEVTQGLIASNAFETFELISNFLVSYVKSFKEAVAPHRDAVTGVMAGLTAALNNSLVGPLKIRAAVAIGNADIMLEKIGLDQLPALIPFVLETLRVVSDEHLYLPCRAVEFLKGSLDQEFASEVFAILVPRLIQSPNDDLVATIAQVLKKLLKRYQVNEAHSQGLVNAILNCTLQSFFGNTPGRLPAPVEPLFLYLAQFVKKTPSKALPIVEKCLDWLVKAYQPLPILIPAVAALNVGIFNPELAARLGPLLKEILDDLDESDGDELREILPIITTLFEKFPNALNPIGDILRKLVQFADAMAPGEEEDASDVSDELLAAMPALGQLVFSVYGSATDTDVIPALLGPVVQMLPFPPQCEAMPDLISGLCQLLDDPKRFECIVEPGVFVLTNLLMKKKSELDEFHFDPDLVGEMKATLKKLVKANKKLQMKLKGQFKASKAKLNHFNALIR